MNRKARRRTREQALEGPSRFFIVAIILGLILFLWLFSLSLTRSAPPAPPPASTSS